jgi:hypothetical protein
MQLVDLFEVVDAYGYLLTPATTMHALKTHLWECPQVDGAMHDLQVCQLPQVLVGSQVHLVLHGG